VIKLQPEEHKSLAQYIYSLCSVVLDESKGYLIEGRLSHLVEQTGAGSYAMLMQRAKSELEPHPGTSDRRCHHH
jgi:CheR methyltransferase, all-alpha domain